MKRLAFGISSSACGLVLLLAGTFAWALNEPSHSLINQEATNRSSLNAFLQEHLGMPDGIRTPIRGTTESRRVEQWIQLGGAREDESTNLEYLTGKARSFRHFHDPLLAWDRSGLFYPLTIPPRITRFESSIRWAQRTDQDRETGHGNYAWPHARRYFLTALTDPNPTVREQAFADTFRALGQTMHLVVDASVPEHVRNDPHPMGEVQDKFGQVGNYEYWVLAQHRIAGTESGFIRDYLSTPIDLDPELLQIVIPSTETIARVPIARLFDSDQYTGSNPDVTAESRIGIAEVANANFVSQDTGYGQYPHPALANMPKYVGTYPKTGEKRAYYSKKGAGTPGGAGLPVDPVAAECVLDEATGVATFCKDDNVWRQTARHMLPRAVRYGQEVLDYFFRGKLEVSREPDPATGLPSLRIVNRSPEPLGENGVLTLYQDNDQGERSAVQGATLTLRAAVPKDNEADPLRLPIPADLAMGGLTLVYQGPLGLEQQAVIGQVLAQVVVEEVYRDWILNEWILRTKDGLYILPLATVAGLSAPPATVRWADRDNQLVAVTGASMGGGGELGGGPGPGGEAPFLALLFELDRPLGSPQVPITNTSASDLPVAAVHLVRQIDLYKVLGALDLQTTVDFAGRLEFAQYLPKYVVTITCVDQDPKPDKDDYQCTETIGQDALDPTPVKTWSDTVRATITPQLTPDHNSPPNWGATHYQWSLVDVRADRENHLVALVGVQTTCLPEEETIQRIPLREVDSSGALVDGNEIVHFDADFFCPRYAMVAVVDLTESRLLAKSSEDRVTIQQTQRVVIPKDVGRFPVGIRYEITYAGGTQNGKGGPWWVTAWGGYPVPREAPTRVGLTLKDHGEMHLDHAEGILRPSLAALGVGDVGAQGTPEAWSFDVLYRMDLDGTAVLLRVPNVALGILTPVYLTGWLQWTGPSPGWLRFQAAAEKSFWSHESTSWLVNWNLKTDGATLVYTETTTDETTSSPLQLATANASGVLTFRWGQDGWLWIPWTGVPLGFPDKSYWDVWDYVALDPAYLYNMVTGHFHALLPSLPEETGPPPLVPRSIPWAQGTYHVVGR